MQTATEMRVEIPHETTLVTAPDNTRHMLGRLRLLWSTRATLNRAATVGLILSTLLAFALPLRYESKAQLMPPDAQSTSGMAMLAALTERAGETLGSVSTDLLGIKSSGQLFIGILTSRTVQDRLVDRFELRKLYRCKLREDARKKLSENTGVTEDRKSGIITITVSDHDRQRAAQLAQAYVDELNRLVAELSTSAAHRERVFLEQRLAEVKKSLDEASQQFSQFSSKNTAIDIKEQGRAMIDAASALTGELIAAESELSGLEQIYNPNNVRVRSVQARIGKLRSKIEELRGSDAGSAEPGGEPEYPTLRKLPLIGVTYADLYRQTKTQEAVYQTLTQEYELAKVQEAKETPSVKVLDAPNLPERRSYPPRLQIILLGSVLGFSAASAWILARARWTEIGEADPGKAFANEIFCEVNARMPWATPNGSRFQAMTHRAWMHLVRIGPRSSNSETHFTHPE